MLPLRRSCLRSTTHKEGELRSPFKLALQQCSIANWSDGNGVYR